MDNARLAEFLRDIATADPSITPQQALLKAINKQIDGRVADWEGIRDICDTASDLVRGNPLAEATLGLAGFNAARRVPDADQSALYERGAKISSLLHANTEVDFRKERGLLHYQLGVLARHIGQFMRAVAEHDKALEIYTALGNKPSAAISKFLIAVELLNEALARGVDPTEAFANLDGAVAEAEAALQGHAWAVNLPAHRLLARAWDDSSKDYPERKSDFALTRERDTGGIYTRLLNALEAHYNNDENAEAKLRAAIVEGRQNRITDVWTTAQLVLARRLAALGYDEQCEAGRLYLSLQAWSGLGGRVVSAIAKRERDALAKLVGPLTP